jgi:hypothetical protein
LISWVPGLLGWQLAGFAALPPAVEQSREVRALWRFSLVSCAVAVGAAFVVHLPALQWLTQAFWSRVAPFGQLGCQVLIAAALVRQGAAPAPSTARRAWQAGAIGVALLLSGKSLHTAPLVTGLAIAAVAAVFAVPPRLAGRACAALAAIALAAALWASPRGAGMTAVPAADPDQLALYRWIREATPLDALFVAPPSLSLFRLMARRAIIADTKSPPLQPALMVRWYRRLCAMVEQGDVATHEEVERLWDRLTPDQLERVARAFHAEYIVVWATTQLPGAPLYINGRFAVYAAVPP